MPALLQLYLHLYITSVLFMLSGLLVVHKTINHHSILNHLQLKLYLLLYIIIRTVSLTIKIMPGISRIIVTTKNLLINLQSIR